MKPSIVLVVTDQETNAQIAKLGVGILELRVDLFKKLDAAYACAQFQNRRKLRIPLLLTVRNQKKEGASKEMSDANKWALMQVLMPLTDWVDIELSSPLCRQVISLARSLGKKVVISTHNFNNMPNNMEQLFKKSLSSRADMVKIAVKANSLEDLIRMMNFTHHNRAHSLVTMCVGPYGALSRLILPAAGSRCIYTFLNQTTAPGQIDVKTLKAHLKFFYGI